MNQKCDEILIKKIEGNLHNFENHIIKYIILRTKMKKTINILMDIKTKFKLI